MDEAFWKPVIESKRKIKCLRKQIRQECKVMERHLDTLRDFFI